MTTTAAIARRIGTCRWNAEHTFIATCDAEQATYCPSCQPVTVESNGWPWTQRSSIKWATVKGRVTKTVCDSACTSAKGEKCSCECGGARHGQAWGLA